MNPTEGQQSLQLSVWTLHNRVFNFQYDFEYTTNYATFLDYLQRLSMSKPNKHFVENYTDFILTL